MKIALTKNGPEISRIVLGMMRLGSWRMSIAELRERIERAIDLGITAFDHADIYGDYTCESIFGEALAGMPSVRSRMQIITKCGIKLVSKRNPGCAIKHYDTSKAHIVSSVENSLKRLRTDHIDILLIHRPDPLMDPDEVADAFVSLRDSGKALHFGVSNFTPAQFEMLSSRVPAPLVTNQVECSVLETGAMEDGTFDDCLRRGIAPMVWGPLAGGALFSGRTERILRVREELEAVRRAIGGSSIDTLALAWLLRHPARLVPVVGTGRMEHIEHAVEAAKLRLSREDWFRILRASLGRDVP